jgi:acetate kinase
VEILVLQSTSKSLRCSCFTDDGNDTLRRIGPFSEAELDHDAVIAVLDTSKSNFKGRCPDMIAVRVVYGGPGFTGPALLDDNVLSRLKELVPQAPMHIPKTLMILARCSEVFPEVSVLLFFETSFFCGLPPREYLYAIEPKSGLRRYGYHGLFHEYARNEARLRQALSGNRNGPAVVSVYCGDHNEIAAINGTMPVMVTSGASPLEGLPGTTMCGDIDPAVLLEIAAKKKWGPERINTVISRHSGITALAGRGATIESIFAPNAGEQGSRAAEVMKYRLLLATGMAAATLGTIDCIVFSGAFSRVGNELGPYLTSHLFRNAPQDLRPKVQWFCMDQPLDDIMAKRARMLFREGKMVPLTA